MNSTHWTDVLASLLVQKLLENLPWKSYKENNKIPILYVIERLVYQWIQAHI